MNEIDSKTIILIAIFSILCLVVGGFVGFFLGSWAGYIAGYEEGVEDGINYYNCVVENTPLYSDITEEIQKDCAFKELDEYYWS